MTCRISDLIPYSNEFLAICFNNLFLWPLSLSFVSFRSWNLFLYCYLDSCSIESGEKIFSRDPCTQQNHLVTDLFHISVYFAILAFWLAFILHLSHLPPAYQDLHNQASIFHSIAPFPLMWDFPPRFWSCLVLPLFHRCVWLKYSPEEEKYQRRISQFLLPSPCDLIICAVETRFYFFSIALLVFPGFSHHVSPWVFLKGGMAVLSAKLYTISAWFLVN